MNATSRAIKGHANKLETELAEAKSWADSMLRKIEVLEAQLETLAERHEKALIQGAELKKELDIWILGHAKLQSEHQAQIAAKDAALRHAREALEQWHYYADDFFRDTQEQEFASDLERIDAALAAPVRETE